MRKIIITTLMLCLCAVNAQAFCFQEAGQQAGINPALLQAIAYHESNHTFNPKIIRKNADGTEDIGLTQINSRHIRPWGLDRSRLISDPCYSVHVAVRVLKNCITKHGYTAYAIGCYNAISPDKQLAYAENIRQILGVKKITRKQIEAPPSQERDPLVLFALLLHSGSGYSGLFRAE